MYPDYIQVLLNELVRQGHIPMDPDNLEKARDELRRKVEEADQGWDTLVREGLIMPLTDERGNVVYRDGEPVSTSSPKVFNLIPARKD